MQRMNRFALLIFTLACSIGSAEPVLVYVGTNSPAGNEVVVLRSSDGGVVEQIGVYSTGGAGTGGGLESQGPLILDGSGRFLFTVNAASNTVSAFRIEGQTLALIGAYPSGGVRPTSLAERRGVLYAMNEGGSGNVTGFQVGDDGSLAMISGSTFPLSRENAGGAQVGFHPELNTLIVTERFSNRICLYRLNDAGVIERGPRVLRSAGRFPFGFTITARNHLLVSEAFGGGNGLSSMSSYRFSKRGTLSIASARVGTREVAACWVSATEAGDFAYTTNTGSNSISSFRVLPSGRMRLLERVAADGGAPTEVVIHHGTRRLFVINASARTVAAYIVEADGALTGAGTISIPLHAVGLAVRN
jgi:6-phosphogluconolactonase